MDRLHEDMEVAGVTEVEVEKHLENKLQKQPHREYSQEEKGNAALDSLNVDILYNSMNLKEILSMFFNT